MSKEAEIPCLFYRKNKCTKGDSCTFSHARAQSIDCSGLSLNLINLPLAPPLRGREQHPEKNEPPMETKPNILIETFSPAATVARGTTNLELKRQPIINKKTKESSHPVSISFSLSETKAEQAKGENKSQPKQNDAQSVDVIGRISKKAVQSDDKKKMPKQSEAPSLPSSGDKLSKKETEQSGDANKTQKDRKTKPQNNVQNVQDSSHSPKSQKARTNTSSDELPTASPSKNTNDEKLPLPSGKRAEDLSQLLDDMSMQKSQRNPTKPQAKKEPKKPNDPLVKVSAEGAKSRKKGGGGRNRQNTKNEPDDSVPQTLAEQKELLEEKLVGLANERETSLNEVKELEASLPQKRTLKRELKVREIVVRETLETSNEGFRSAM